MTGSSSAISSGQLLSGASSASERKPTGMRHASYPRRSTTDKTALLHPPVRGSAYVIARDCLVTVTLMDAAHGGSSCPVGSGRPVRGRVEISTRGRVGGKEYHHDRAAGTGGQGVAVRGCRSDYHRSADVARQAAWVGRQRLLNDLDAGRAAMAAGTGPCAGHRGDDH